MLRQRYFDFFAFFAGVALSKRGHLLPSLGPFRAVLDAGLVSDSCHLKAGAPEPLLKIVVLQEVLTSADIMNYAPNLYINPVNVLDVAIWNP